MTLVFNIKRFLITLINSMSLSITQVLYDDNLLSLIYKLTGEVTILDINSQINKSKKRILIIYLNRLKSFLYYNDEFYRIIINNLVEDTKKQLSIYLHFHHGNSYSNVSDDFLINLQNLRFLDLRDNKHISNINVLYTCHSLKLYNCRNVSNVNSLGNLHYLDLSFCHLVTDVSMLANLNTLILQGCLGIQDFSNLGKISKLNLSHTNIINTTGLGNVQNIILNNCDNLVDISTLKTNKKVTIIYNKNISDVSSLRGVDTVKIGNILKLVDVSMLKTIKKLTIFECNKITDISTLNKVPYLVLSNLYNVLDICSLGDHDTLKISNCGNNYFNLKETKMGRLNNLSRVRTRLVIGKEMLRDNKGIVELLNRKVKYFEVIN